MKVAIASTPEEIFPGHFAHAPIFKIYTYSGGRLEPVEERQNPLSSMPDHDLHGGHHGGHHGDKYKWLRENVLPDVDVVIAGGACQRSHNYFTSEGVKMIYVEPVDVETLVRYIEENPEEFENAVSR